MKAMSLPVEWKRRAVPDSVPDPAPDPALHAHRWAKGMRNSQSGLQYIRWCVLPGCDVHETITRTEWERQ